MIDDLQKVLDKFPRHGLAKEERDQCPICIEQEKWIEDVTALLTKLVQERDDNKLLVIQAVTKLRAKEEELDGKILVDRKQLSEDKEWYENCLKTCSECTTTRPICEDRLARLKELLAGSVGLPLCEKCKVTMKVLSTRDDGCRYFECPECGGTMGEETEEWFKQQEGSTSLSRFLRVNPSKIFLRFHDERRKRV